jgi:hypothetical protein
VARAPHPALTLDAAALRRDLAVDAVSSHLLTHPIDQVRIIQQTEGSARANGILTHMFQREGWQWLAHGLSLEVARGVCSPLLEWCLRNLFLRRQAHYRRLTNKELLIVLQIDEAALRSLKWALWAIVAAPIDLIFTAWIVLPRRAALAAAAAAADADDRSASGLVTAFSTMSASIATRSPAIGSVVSVWWLVQEIYSRQGLLSFFVSAPAGAVGSLAYRAILQTLFSAVEKRRPKRHRGDGAIRFAVTLACTIVGSVATMPFDTIRRKQMEAIASGRGEAANPVAAARAIATQRGWGGFFDGAALLALRTAVTFAAVSLAQFALRPWITPRRSPAADRNDETTKRHALPSPSRQ